ncbi:hypothetical protein FACS189499_06260 [Clostridia bacterium]|nr:hypothetical protein FACS189499_06260 [Clostridia bacterium]
MALEGQPMTQIRDTFCAKRLPSPQEHIELRRGNDILTQCVWTTRMILHMLTNEQYIGTYIAGKQEQKAVGSKSKINIDKSDWIVIPDSYTPIVCKEDFAKVQELLLTKLKGTRTFKPLDNPLESDDLSHRRTKMVNGESKVAVPIYGYVKAKGGGLAIDEPAAVMVREIFSLAAEGKTSLEIAETLTKKQTQKPNEYKKFTKRLTKKTTKKLAKSQLSAWSDRNVECIINNIQYTGAYVSGRILKDRETGKKYHVPQSNWIIILGKNPAIISQDLFDKVQKIFSKSKTNLKRSYHLRNYMLRGGILKCGCCGYSLSYDDILDPVYRCHHTLGTPDAECHKMKVNVRKLDETILVIIRKQAEIVLNSGDLTKLRKVGDNGKRIADFEKEVNRCVEERQRAYEQFVLREIDRETYQKQKSDCSERIDKFNNQIAVSKQAERDILSGVKTNAIAKDILSKTLTNREIIETLIDKIKVFPEDKLEIIWKIADFGVIG